MTPTTQLPLPVVTPEVEAFAAEKGVTEYLPKLLAVARELFPTEPMIVEVYEDHEIRDWKTIHIEVRVPMDTDFIGTIRPRADAWRDRLFEICPSTHVHAFRLLFQTVP